jgi:hypothetical protein
LKVPSQGRFIFYSFWLPPHRAIWYDVEEGDGMFLRNKGTYVSILHRKITVFKTSKPTHAVCCLIQSVSQIIKYI